MTSHIRVKACALIIEKGAVLLVEFKDEHGVHYNLPGGGVNPGETVKEAACREAFEEASIEVEVGPLAFVYEYVPHLCHHKYGDTASLQLIFDCKRKDGSMPRRPEYPDMNQTDVKWIKLKNLKNVVLYPDVKETIILYNECGTGSRLIEEPIERGFSD